MNRLSRVLGATAAAVALSALTYGAASAAAVPAKADTSEIAGLFTTWNAALATGDAQKVADMYAPDAVLLPTVSNEVRSDRAEIVDYFTNDFLPKKPHGTVRESHVSVFDADSAAHSGTYDFVLTGKDGSTSVVPARFTFVYEKIDGQWLIEEHHSSAMPE